PPSHRLALKGATQRVTGLSFSRDGSYLAGCSVDGNVHVWHTQTGRLFTSRGSGPGARSLCFSPAGNYLATGGAGAGPLGAWPPPGPRPPLPPSRCSGVALCVAFSPDGRAVLAGCDDGTAWLRGWSTGRLLTPPLRQRGAVRAVSFDRSGSWALTGTD